MVQPTPQALAVACVLRSDSPEPIGPNKRPLVTAADWNKLLGTLVMAADIPHPLHETWKQFLCHRLDTLEFCISTLLTMDSGRTSLPPPTSWAAFRQLVAVTVNFWDSKSVLNTHDPAGWPREVLPVFIQHPAPSSTKEREATYM